MKIIAWAPIEAAEIPPFGESLSRHILSYRNPDRRSASCAAWCLLYREMQKRGLSPGELCFAPGGKPYFSDQRLHFSLAHSGKICAVSLSDRPTGIDVEQIKASYDPHLIERCLSPGERECFDGDFPRLWCRKEAAGKLTGEGLVYPPSQLDTLRLPCQFEERRIRYQDQEYWLAAAYADEKTTFI